MKETDGWVKIKKYTDCEGDPVCANCPHCGNGNVEWSDNKNRWIPGPSCQIWHGESKSDYAYKTVAEYEGVVGYRVNEAFKIGWDMARVTDKMLSDLASNSREK